MNENKIFNKIKIIAVDNDRGSLYLIRSLLTSLGCEGDFLDTIEGAVAKLKANKYDICFTDINLPVANGLQLTRFIRDTISKDMPIIAVTGSVLPENKDICFNAGMNGFIAKPVNIKILQDEINRHLTA